MAQRIRNLDIIVSQRLINDCTEQGCRENEQKRIATSSVLVVLIQAGTLGTCPVLNSSFSS